MNKAPKNKVTPQKVFDKMVANGGKMKPAVIAAGLSPAYAQSGKFQKTKGWQELIDKYISEDKLVKVHSEGLNAGKKVFKNNNSTGEIEEVYFEPDYAVRHKYLETGYKIRRRLSDKQEGDKTQNNIFIFSNDQLQRIAGNLLNGNSTSEK